MLKEWLRDEGLIAWAYCQDGRCYMPTDEILSEGGYEVVNSNANNKSGPGPFAPGLNEAVKRAFLRLRDKIKIG